jgi:glutamyl-tRNA synthetase
MNFLAIMGWSFGQDVEFFSIDDMIKKFEFKDIHLGGPVFDTVKLTWMNQHYMHKMSEERFVQYIRNEIFSDAYLRALKPFVLERMSRFEQFVDNNAFFFNGALTYDLGEVIPKGKSAVEIIEMLNGLVEKLDDLYEWSHDQLKALIEAYKDSIGWKPKDVFMTLRLVVTGRKDSPPLFESLELVGREMVRFRLRDCIQKLAQTSENKE